MSVWRRRALEAFPELRNELNDRHEISSIYELWFELLALTDEAHRKKDDDFLRRVYGYAEWCRVQRDKDIWNSVGVCFYEHVLDEPSTRDTVIPWLSNDAIADHMVLWEESVPAAELKRIAPSQLAECAGC